MKMAEFLWNRTNKGKTAAKPKEATITAGAESTLFLLMVPEMEVLTLLMEQELSKNELSW